MVLIISTVLHKNGGILNYLVKWLINSTLYLRAIKIYISNTYHVAQQNAFQFLYLSVFCRLWPRSDCFLFLAACFDDDLPTMEGACLNPKLDAT